MKFDTNAVFILKIIVQDVIIKNQTDVLWQLVLIEQLSNVLLLITKVHAF